MTSAFRPIDKGMGQAVAERTILRTINDKLENWGDVAHRVALGNSLLCPDQKDQPNEYHKLCKHISNATLLMSGRHLSNGDKNQPSKNMEVFSNCSTSSTSFLEFFLLLCGSGVGRSYDDDMMLVNWDNAPTVRCVLDNSHPDFDYSAHESVRDAKHKYGSGKNVSWFNVPDTREGWGQALEVWEVMAFEKIHKDRMLIIDFSNVRPSGTPIEGLGGKPASGPVPIMNAFYKASNVKGAGLEPWLQSMYIDHIYASCVLVGGVRRCLDENDEVLLRGRVWKKIKDVVIGDYVLMGDTPYKVLDHIDSGTTKEMVRIHTKDGYQESTKSHKWLVKDVDTDIISWVVADKFIGIENKYMLINTDTDSTVCIEYKVTHAEFITYDNPIQLYDISVDSIEAFVVRNHTTALTCVTHNSARIATKTWRDKSVIRFIKIKRPTEYDNMKRDEVIDYRSNQLTPSESFLWTSNNSVMVDEEFWVLNNLKSTDENYNSDIARHARKVFKTITECSYADGTGEPGIINVDKLVKNNDGWGDLSRGDYVGSDKYKINDDTDLYLSKLAKTVLKKKHNVIVNPCGEIVLNMLGGFCVIADVVPYHANTIDEAEDAFRTSVRALIRVNTMNSVYGKEVKRTNRIGVGMTGVHEFAWKFFGYGFKDLIDENKSMDFWKTLSRFNRAVKEESDSYSKKLGVNPPMTSITQKPAGCGSLDSLIRTNKGDMTFRDIFDANGIDVSNMLPKQWFFSHNKSLKIYDKFNKESEISSLYCNGVESVYKITFGDGKSYKFTGNHKFLIHYDGCNEWKRLDSITIDDIVVPSSEYTNIKSIVKLDTKEMTVDIEIDGSHSYQLSNSVIVHNTTSKLFGLSEGWHLPSMRRYLRWVQFKTNDKLIEKYRLLGYPVRELVTYEGTSIVGFPTEPNICTLGMGDKLMTAGEATIEEQYKWVMLGEKYWIRGDEDTKDTGNQISYTLKYNPDKVHYNEFKRMMKHYQSKVKCCSVMPQIKDVAYEYQPEQPISDNEYDKIMGGIKEHIKEDVNREHVDCAKGGCPIDFDDAK